MIEMKKILVVGVILLFIGVAVAPSINHSVVKASTDDDLVEVTTQACGIKGYGNTTVKLTREQYQNLEQYLVEFRARLNQTSTREEAVPIFKDAVVELDKYGLLPRGMSVEQAQKLVLGFYELPKINRFLDSKVQKKVMSEGNMSNIFCLLSGRSYQVTKTGPISRTISKINYLIIKILYGFSRLALMLFPLILFLSILNDFFYFINFLFEEVPITFYSTIFFGYISKYKNDGSLEYHPDDIDIWSQGQYGEQSYKGNCYGNLRAVPGVFLAHSEEACMSYQVWLVLQV